ncbi:NifU family protein [Haloferax larsenii]|uniref:Fe-S cluster biogenesis protein NfuA, 4Fe-4S-binding domain n=1 Tax=Haloferax larsenii TaxID=302484 RepID=A0A1H7R2B4_HALLR|nr:NifU family protein [Haloferax larsenii]SEL54118.1 Fe-S cluster biogenesis protein NfuA, 4Fe-4S-binding domain [Haloferax larsenii]
MSAEGLERQTRSYLSNNIPQIQQHGGFFEIQDVDEDAGEVTVAIGGACSGCGIAPMTMKAIRHRLPEELDDISKVNVVRAGGPRAAVMPTKTEEMEEMDEYEDYSPPF